MQREFLALLSNRTGCNTLAPQLAAERFVVGGNALTADLLAACVRSRKCKNWHVALLLSNPARLFAPTSLLLLHPIPARHVVGRWLAAQCFPAPLAIPACWIRLSRLAPRAIISFNSSWLLDRDSAISIEICFWKYAVASD